MCSWQARHKLKLTKEIIYDTNNNPKEKISFQKVKQKQDDMLKQTKYSMIICTKLTSLIKITPPKHMF